METRAWQDQRFTYPRSVPTMLCAEELLYLCWLGEHVWSGSGVVVEIGPWLGGSTVCLAAGMARSGHDTHKQLVAIDNFLWRDFMAARADLPLRSGDSFRSAFEKNVSPYEAIVDGRALALPDEFIPGDAEARRSRFDAAEGVPLFEGPPCAPIEILFIDGAKSWRGMRHLLRELSEAFIAGRTLIVCQDFKYWGAYWVPLLMARLGDCLEPLHNVLSGTTVTFRLTRELPKTLLDELETGVAELDIERTLGSIARTAAQLETSGDHAGSLNVQLAKTRFLAHRGEWAAAAEALAVIQASWDLWTPPEQLRRAHLYLSSEHGLTRGYPLRLSVVDTLRRGRRRIRALLGV